MLASLPGISLKPLAGAVPAWRAELDAQSWREAATAAAAAGARLGALWSSDERDRGGGLRVHALLVCYEGLVCLELPVPTTQASFPDLSNVFPCAGRMQRAAYDLMGTRAVNATGQPADARGWLRHAAWPENVFPLRRDVASSAVWPTGEDHYPFVTVEGDGVHEIPVGPVHAGTIEPGHFRFSVVGERVLRLEERLGYKHKGVEKRFEQMKLEDAFRLAGRISGDSTVAYAWAYAMALESMAGTQPADRALLLRALLLERERIANHLGDLGYLGNDGGLAFGLAQFSRLKEDVLRLNAGLFGHRYLMDCVVPGGVAVDLEPAGVAALLEEAERLERDVQRLRAIYDDHAGLQDRFVACGRLSAETAALLGVVGFAARASGLAIDARIYPAWAPYDQLEPRICTRRHGDVAARVNVRFEELLESLRLERLILRRLPPGARRVALPPVADGTLGFGWIEGWRGEIFVALEAGTDGAISRCHPHDPSWQIWPALEHAILGNIVPDFPLINKSFNLSYAGQDL
jgi:Ni,Fe-hydrogenase III large subunit/Ni,Fe-hydrogenase III component G